MRAGGTFGLVGRNAKPRLQLDAPGGTRTHDLRLRRTVPPTPGNASQRGGKELALAGAGGQRPRRSRKCCHSGFACCLSPSRLLAPPLARRAALRAPPPRAVRTLGDAPRDNRTSPLRTRIR